MSLDNDEWRREYRDNLVDTAKEQILLDSDRVEEIIKEEAQSICAYYYTYLEKNNKAVSQVIKDHYLTELGYKLQELLNHSIDDMANEDVTHQLGDE